MNRVLICCLMALCLPEACVDVVSAGTGNVVPETTADETASTPEVALGESVVATIESLGVKNAFQALLPYLDLNPMAQVTSRSNRTSKSGRQLEDLCTEDDRHIAVDVAARRIASFAAHKEFSAPSKASDQPLTEESALRIAKSLIADGKISGLSDEGTIDFVSQDGGETNIWSMVWLYEHRGIRCGACVMVGVSHENGKVVQFLDNGPIEPPEVLEPAIPVSTAMDIALEYASNTYGASYSAGKPACLFIILPRKGKTPDLAKTMSSQPQGMLAWKVNILRSDMVGASEVTVYLDAGTGEVLKDSK